MQRKVHVHVALPYLLTFLLAAPRHWRVGVCSRKLSASFGAPACGLGVKLSAWNWSPRIGGIELTAFRVHHLTFADPNGSREPSGLSSDIRNDTVSSYMNVQS